MTAQKIIGYITGGIMFAAGLTLYIFGTVMHRSDLIQPAYWLTVVGGSGLGLQVSLPTPASDPAPIVTTSVGTTTPPAEVTAVNPTDVPI